MGKHVFTRKANKISICFEGAHETGSLYHMLSHLIYNGINMDHIESRPPPERNWEYRFFVDFEGNLNDPAVQNALRDCRKRRPDCRFWGITKRKVRNVGR